MICFNPLKCFSFALTFSIYTFDLKSNIKKFSQKLRLIEFFANTEDNEEDESLLRNPSEFCPPANRNRKSDFSINFLNGLNLDIRKKKKSNLRKEQWNAISRLKNNDGIIIKEADKGGSVVIMTKKHYKKMVYEQLNDNITYRRTNDSWDKKVMKELGKLVEKYKDNLMDKSSSRVNTSSIIGAF